MCDQHTCALNQVSEVVGAVLVAVGDGRRYRCAERLLVKRQLLQRLQQPECLRRLRLLRRKVKAISDLGLGYVVGS